MGIQSYGERLVQDSTELFLTIHLDHLRRYDEILRAIDELPSPQKEETLVRLLMESDCNAIDQATSDRKAIQHDQSSPL